MKLQTPKSSGTEGVSRKRCREDSVMGGEEISSGEAQVKQEPADRERNVKRVRVDRRKSQPSEWDIKLANLSALIDERELLVARVAELDDELSKTIKRVGLHGLY